MTAVGIHTDLVPKKICGTVDGLADSVDVDRY